MTENAPKSFGKAFVVLIVVGLCVFAVGCWEWRRVSPALERLEDLAEDDVLRTLDGASAAVRATSAGLAAYVATPGSPAPLELRKRYHETAAGLTRLEELFVKDLKGTSSQVEGEAFLNMLRKAVSARTMAERSLGYALEFEEAAMSADAPVLAQTSAKKAEAELKNCGADLTIVRRAYEKIVTKDKDVLRQRRKAALLTMAVSALITLLAFACMAYRMGYVRAARGAPSDDGPPAT